MSSGYVNLVLHAHLPYIKHPGQKNHIEQRWFYEAVSECYLPLLETLDRLDRNGNDFHITLSLSPTLCVMLNDDDLKDGCESYLSNIVELTAYKKKRGRGKVSSLNDFYHLLHRERLQRYKETYNRDLISAFKRLSEKGRLALITTSATHAYLPLLEDFPQALNAQIKGGLHIFNKMTGVMPDGFWLPECGYSPDIEKVMAHAGIKFTTLESHGIIFANPRPSNILYDPVLGPHGVLVFGRDSNVSQLVWSAKSGYPADIDYRDFFEDAVYELSEDEARRFIHPEGIRVPSGIKYKKITGKGKKEIYDPDVAAGKVKDHASHFIRHISSILSEVGSYMDSEPTITVAFDAELFGHWWYEGCGWLEEVLAGLSEQHDIMMISGNRFLEMSRRYETVTPESSSWGKKGYSETWINPRNDWMVRYVHSATEQFVKLATANRNVQNIVLISALNSAARELMMLQASDWSFIMNEENAISYVEDRFMRHYNRVMNIIDMVHHKEVDKRILTGIEREDGEFVKVDYKWFCEGR
jgi:1,4-alpha-glucan branching enzyme